MKFGMDRRGRYDLVAERILNGREAATVLTVHEKGRGEEAAQWPAWIRARLPAVCARAPDAGAIRATWNADQEPSS